MKVLLVEDNHELAAWLGKALKQANYAVDIAHDGEDAGHLLNVAVYAVVILDLSLPKIDGMTLLKGLRQAGNNVPVIILTANASLDGRVAGLDGGADDYLAKPFEIAELEARIRALVRRGHDRAAPEIAIGDLIFDGGTRQFTLAGETLVLTPREHAVLEHLALKVGTTVARQYCRKASSASTTQRTQARSKSTSIGCARSSRAARPRLQLSAALATCCAMLGEKVKSLGKAPCKPSGCSAQVCASSCRHGSF
ncbi:DNA-binding response OmpR family regulator [Rhizobium pisi]|uniref:DNA-binding response OmpR family regulator n=1 Tax=Rhizobium pisi TaxID=574561 RepID=A0A7W5BN31_9HYPH|nr:DNA-binding response OmpR family regulator [Rhizobium pisi]